MIGVAYSRDEQEVVEELFQIFKTPWEPLAEGKTYDVIITVGCLPATNRARLTVVYGPSKTLSSNANRVAFETHSERGWTFDYEGHEVPVYGPLTLIHGEGEPVLKSTQDQAVIALLQSCGSERVMWVGYNLFAEVRELLTKGQPIERASVPALDIHISLLRQWILQSGLSLVEIPAFPAGYSHFACLTHDIDFIGIRRHCFDHSMFGFLRRATLDTFIGVLKRKAPASNLIRNAMAVLSLPFVYAGMCHDFWSLFNYCRRIEGKHRSTFFLIPFKNTAGGGGDRPASHRRATRYDVADVVASAKSLIAQGCEIGVHGIDSWRDVDSGKRELSRVKNCVGTADVGIRMHWLYWGLESAGVLDAAGYTYDSTFGYNETVGFRAGTFHPFRPLGASSLIELPMHLQDVSLFARNYMYLSQSDAWKEFCRLQSLAAIHGGVFTMLWHLRSFGPERYLAKLYVRMLGYLEQRGARIDTGENIIKWFNTRRQVRFQNVHLSDGSLHVQLSGVSSKVTPFFLMRVHLPQSVQKKKDKVHQNNNIIDVPFSDNCELNVSIGTSK